MTARVEIVHVSKQWLGGAAATMAYAIASVLRPDAGVHLDGARVPPAFALAAGKIARPSIDEARLQRDSACLGRHDLFLNSPRGSTRSRKDKIMSGRKQTIPAASTNGDTVGIAARFGCRAKPAKSLAILAIAGLLAGALPQVAAAADPHHVFAKCTSTLNSLKNALTFNDTAPPATRLRVQDLQASYIVIHVRQNPNDGQKIGTTTPSTYTGPVLCVNSA